MDGQHEQGVASGASPIFMLGVFILVLPFLANAIQWSLPGSGIISGIGLFLIIIGVIHTIWQRG